MNNHPVSPDTTTVQEDKPLTQESLKSVIAANIADLRKKQGMTQQDLAERLNYTDKAISKWERGESLPDVLILKQIADMFGVTVDYLLCRQEKRFVDISDLTEEEASVVCSVVEVLRKKHEA